MARIPRILIADDRTAYHVISRTVLPGYPLEDVEKDFFIALLKKAGRFYFVEIIGFCCMGNHFHLLVRMLPDSDFSDRDIHKRIAAVYGEKRVVDGGEIPEYRRKLASLSELLKEIKVSFTRFYNRRHGRRGFFWNDRFKSVVVENGATLINCLAYIDLNPVRAGIVKQPEDYRWNSIGYHVQTGNQDHLLSMNFSLGRYGENHDEAKLDWYRRFLYEIYASDDDASGDRGDASDAQTAFKMRNDESRMQRRARFNQRTRYFTDSGIIGGKPFVAETYQKVKNHFQTKREKKPRPITGLGGIYSIKRLSEPKSEVEKDDKEQAEAV